MKEGLSSCAISFRKSRRRHISTASSMMSNSEQVCENNRVKHEISAIGVRGNLGKRIPELTVCLVVTYGVGVVDKVLHLIETQLNSGSRMFRAANRNAPDPHAGSTIRMSRSAS